MFLFLSCSQPFQILKSTDKFYPDQKTIYTTPITVKSSNPFDFAELEMDFGYTVSSDTSLKFFDFTYTGKEWAFMKSLRILIDGKVFKVNPVASPKHQMISMGLVSELMTVKIDNDLFSLIKNARQIDVRVVGEKRSFDFTFDEELKGYFKEFLQQINE